MPPLLMRLSRQTPGASGPIDGCLIPRQTPKPSPTPDPLLVSATAGMPFESLRALGPGLPGPAITPILDRFDRSNEKPINYPWQNKAAPGSVGSAWVSGNTWTADGSSSGTGAVYLGAGPFGADQEVYATMTTLPGNSIETLALYCRWKNPGTGVNETFAWWRIQDLGSNNMQWVFWQSLNSTNTNVLSGGVLAYSVGDRYCLRVVDNTYEGWQFHSSVWTKIFSYTDYKNAAPGPGYLGLGHASLGGAWDDFGGGELAPGPNASMPWESLKGIQALSNAAIDQGGTAKQTTTIPWESLGGIKSTASAGTFPWELLAGIAALAPSPIEWLSLVLKVGGAMPWESLAGVRATLSSPWESLSGIRATLGAPIESLAVIAKVAGTPFENLQGLRQTLSPAYEYLQGIRALLGGPFESSGGVRAPVGAPFESLMTLAITRGAPFEGLQGVTRQAAEPFESLRGIGAVVGLPIESMAALRVLASLWFESLAKIAPTIAAPWESLAGATHGVSQTAILPWESLGPVRATRGLPLDVRTGLPGLRLHLSESERAPGLVMVEYVEERLDEAGGLVMSETVKAGLVMSESAPIT